MLVGIQQTFLEISEFRRILKCLQDSVVQIETGVFRHFRAENLYFRDERLVSNFSPNNCIAESGKTFVKSRTKLKRFSKQTKCLPSSGVSFRCKQTRARMSIQCQARFVSYCGHRRKCPSVATAGGRSADLGGGDERRSPIRLVVSEQRGGLLCEFGDRAVDDF